MVMKTKRRIGKETDRAVEISFIAGVEALKLLYLSGDYQLLVDRSRDMPDKEYRLVLKSQNDDYRIAVDLRVELVELAKAKLKGVA